MTDDADALWKPGPASDSAPDSEPDRPSTSSHTPAVESAWAATSTVEFERAPMVIPLVEEPAPVRTAPAQRSASRVKRRWPLRTVAAGAAVLAVILAAGSVIVISRSGELTASTDATAGVVSEPLVRPLVTQPFDGADVRRIPTSLDQRWSMDIAGVQVSPTSSVVVAPNGDVVGVFDTGVDNTAVVIALDGGSGVERWRTEVDSGASAFDILGVLDDVIVLERNLADDRSLVGVELLSGEQRWEKITDDAGVHVQLHATSMVARVPLTDDVGLAFIDPSTGEEVGQVQGQLLATDYFGSWYVRNGTRVVRLDLSDGWVPPVQLERVLPDDNSLATVIDGRLVVVVDGEVQEIDGGLQRPLTVSVDATATSSIDAPSNAIHSFNPMVDGTFVFSASDRVYGAELAGDDISVRWSSRGVPVDVQPTEAGLAVQIATDGGASQRIVNASTGAEIAVIPLVPGGSDRLDVVGNGVVLQQSLAVGAERVAFDLEGNRLWSLLGEGRIAIGRDAVVSFDAIEDGATMTLYGNS